MNAMAQLAQLVLLASVAVAMAGPTPATALANTSGTEVAVVVPPANASGAEVAPGFQVLAERSAAIAEPNAAAGEHVQPAASEAAGFAPSLRAAGSGSLDVLGANSSHSLLGANSSHSLLRGSSRSSGCTIVRRQFFRASDGKYWFSSPIGRVVVGFYPVGDLAIQDAMQDYAVMWNTNTSGGRGAVLAFQQDGNLVIYSSSAMTKALWATGTDGTGAVCARIQDDCNLVLYDEANNPVWASAQQGGGQKCS